jgi:hypothetical protein
MAKRIKKLGLIDTLTRVKECLSLLPGEDEKQRIVQIIPEIIKELDVFRENISRFPDESETQQVSNAIHTLVSFLNTLKDKPLLAEMLLPKKAKPRKTKDIFVDIDALQQQLKELPPEKIVEELSKYKKDILFELSKKINITASTKLTKDALVDKIFKLGYANKRGYDLLSGRQS